MAEEHCFEICARPTPGSFGTKADGSHGQHCMTACITKVSWSLGEATRVATVPVYRERPGFLLQVYRGRKLVREYGPMPERAARRKRRELIARAAR